MGENLPALSSPFPTEFAPVDAYPHFLGRMAYQFHFPNGFGASIIPDHRVSWELAVLKKDGEEWPLTYDTIVSGDVLPGLSNQEVAEKLAVIARLDSNGRLPALTGPTRLKDEYRMRLEYTGEESDPEHSNAEWAHLMLDRQGRAVFSDGTYGDDVVWSEVYYTCALVLDSDDALDVLRNNYPQAFENGE